MRDPSIFIDILDARSFASIWYWLGFGLIWTSVTRGAFGIPPAIIRQARRGDGTAARQLLAWLRLVMPAWRIGGGEGALLAAGIGFLLTSVWVLAFHHGLQLPQALVPLVGPLTVLLVLRIRLAWRLDRLTAALDAGSGRIEDVASNAAKLLIRHRWLGLLLFFLAMLLAMLLAAAWAIRHPMGY